MKKRIKKTALLTSLIGLVVTATTLYFGYGQYELNRTGERVDGTVMRIISINSDDGTTYKPEISYSWKNQNQIYTPSYGSSANSRRVGDIVPLRVSERGVTIDGIHGGIIGLAVGLLLGLITTILGVIWFFKHRKDFDNAARLKRYGRKVHARFMRKDATGYKVNNRSGFVLFLQEEDGERVFQTNPIFSEFSVKWLEEHLFDIYLDTRDDTNYYVDMEKHFGEPQVHEK